MSEKVCVIYTGGTIGMQKTPHGYAPAPGYLKTALDEISELGRLGMPSFDIVELTPLLDSSNISVPEWNKIAALIGELYDAYDGFVILHGTDTMAYTASALSFMLEGLDKPVILTGSQIPLCELRSDARDNLITSLIIAGDGVVREVALYFGGRLLRGNRATKISADGLVAFKSPNFPPLAEAGITIKYDRRLKAESREREPFAVRALSCVPIGVLKVFPGLQFGLFESVMTEKLSGIVLETFGTGNIPTSDGALLPIIKKAFASGGVVVVCSQCPQGSVSLGAYETSSALKEAGAVSGMDMTTEAAVAKLYYLFSKYDSVEKIKQLMECSLRGELNET
ncbi:MAG: asparaginase [Clostridia bacterium]|nr:asparaginase [Clostridia bacterium]